MNKEECLKMAKALNMDWDVIEFPTDTGMDVFVKKLVKESEGMEEK